MSNIEKKLKELNLILPEPPQLVGAFVPVKLMGNIAYTSGHDCRVNGQLKYEGKLGAELTIEQGYDAAKITMINLLAVLKDELGNLDRVKQVVKLLAFVNSAEGFVKQPLVVNGASELLQEIFGEQGKHARSAVGVNELPFNAPVEIEMIVELYE